MSTVDPVVSFVETLKFGDFPKLLRLCADKFTKSNRTTWSKRSEDKKTTYITCLNKVVSIVSGGETKECLEDFAKGKRAKNFIISAQTGSAKTSLAEKDINNLLHNLMVVYRRLQNKGRPQDACRLMPPTPSWWSELQPAPSTLLLRFLRGKPARRSKRPSTRPTRSPSCWKDGGGCVGTCRRQVVGATKGWEEAAWEFGPGPVFGR